MSTPCLYLIVGPVAVGKMTVGQLLAEELNIPLLHNHDSIELALKFGYYGTPQFAQINEGIRKLIFTTMANSTEAKGLIFTLVWDFSDQRDWKYVRELKHLFESHGWQFNLVELNASLEERLRRNVSENRLQHKPSKRNTQLSQENLLHSEDRHRMTSISDLTVEFPNFLKLDTTYLTANQSVEKILAHFQK